ncbi:MAG TPA: hypothetical protein VKU85_12295, partial [bacterium]|nr:hypothetical protein [bacterium]
MNRSSRLAVASCAVVLAAAAPAAHAQVIERQLTFGTFTDDAPAWQPTDSLVVFETQRTGNLDIFKVKTTPSTEIQITFNLKADQTPDWSPDGQSIVYSAVADAGLDLYVRSIAGGPAILLHEDSTAADRFPSWSPDGTTIAFESAGDIFLIPAGGGTPTPVTTDPGFDGHPSWSPDGSRIVFQSGRSGNSDLWVIPSAGGTATQITSDLSNESAPDWSPIGDLIAFQTDRSGFANVWVVPSTGGTQTQITSNAFGDDFRPDWSPAGNELALARTGSVWLAAFAVTGLSVAADVTPTAPSEGDSVTYTITAANAGPHDATGVEVTDMLPSGVTFVSASASQGAYAAGPGVWTVGALPVSAAETLTLIATVDPGTSGQQIDNLAALTASDSLDADTADDEATASILVDGGGPTAAPGPVSRPQLALAPPAPSPFRERTAIRLSLPEPGPVSLVVYDV